MAKRKNKRQSRAAGPVPVRGAALSASRDIPDHLDPTLDVVGSLPDSRQLAEAREVAAETISAISTRSRHVPLRETRSDLDTRLEEFQRKPPLDLEGLDRMTCKPRPRRGSGGGKPRRPYVPWCKK